MKNQNVVRDPMLVLVFRQRGALLKKKDDAEKESNDARLHFGIWVGGRMKVDTRTI